MTVQNLLADATPERLTAHGCRWDHLRASEPLPGGGLRMTVSPRSDYFRDPAGEFTLDNGPCLWLEVEGDFVARTRVRPTFSRMYDAGGLLVRHDETRWAKLCFESTNFNTTAAISVVTRDRSDDANGVDLVAPDVWLQVCRVGDTFGMHYALDGASWRKVRRFHLALPPAVRVGIYGQAYGEVDTTVDFLHFSVEPRTVANLRAGI